MGQFTGIDTDRNACFLFPESFVSQYFVVMEVCKKAADLRPVRNLFPDEEKLHYLAVFDKKDMDTVLLMFHLLYTNGSSDLFGGYSLYDYPFLWYQTHLQEEGTVLRSPYLPDRLARYQGNLPFCHNPAKTVYVRRNIEHILEEGYFSSELELFLSLTRTIMPFFQWWYLDLALYEEKDGYWHKDQDTAHRGRNHKTEMEARTDPVSRDTEKISGHSLPVPAGLARPPEPRSLYSVAPYGN